MLNGDVLWEGVWTCRQCKSTYPHRQGVAFPSVLNLEWTTTLGEALARRRIFARELEGSAFEGERAERHEEQSTSVARVMDDLFQAAMREASLAPGQAILDVGAGLCDTSSAWAAAGHEVTAVETEANNLLHLRFEGIHHGQPEYVDLPARRVHVAELSLRPHLFDRVVAPIHRLPFASGSFDVVFCRSVLHHLDDLSGCIREMMRVLRPGGLFLACSEPARGVLDSEEEQLVGGIDKEDGLNEQLPAWRDYHRALRPWSKRIRVQPWLQDASPRVARFESLDVLHLRRRIWPGQTVEGWRLLKLLPFSASINLLATRNHKPAPPPLVSLPALEDFSIKDVARVSCPPSLRDSIDRFHENTQQLAQGWRRMKLLKGGLCSSFSPGLVGEKALQIGWRRRVVDSAGRAYRHTNKTALVTLMHPVTPRAELLTLQARSPGDLSAHVSVRINGIVVGQLDLAPREDWHSWRIPLPPDIHGTQNECGGLAAYDVELLATSTQKARAEPGDGEAGLAVLNLALLPAPTAPTYGSGGSSQQ